MKESAYFLPYQQRWLDDDAPIKIWEKSRRVGATYVQAYEDVRDCVLGRVPSVWFSSADESAAKEYILYCQQWAKMLNVAASDLGFIVVDKEDDLKALCIELANGRRIHGLSSNPSAFRSKGGKVILDEFAFHKDQKAMWAAARPVTTWGYPLRVLSTYNGKSNLYYKFVDDCKKGKLNWKLHSTPIQLAVEEGLYDKIAGRRTTPEERQAWLADLEASCRDKLVWLQEFCCIASDEATAFLEHELLSACERDDVLMPLEDTTGDLYLGMDIGRRKNLTVLWVVEKLGFVKYTRMVKVLEKMPFRKQREALFAILEHPHMRRSALDGTGIGMQLAEEAQEKFGKYMVEDVTFTSGAKEQMAFLLRSALEDRQLYLPEDEAIHDDLHSVRKLTTATGGIRFDVEASSNPNSHADWFWAAALANYAAGAERNTEIDVQTGSGRQETALNLGGFGALTEKLFAGFFGKT